MGGGASQPPPAIPNPLAHAPPHLCHCKIGWLGARWSGVVVWWVGPGTLIYPPQSTLEQFGPGRQASVFPCSVEPHSLGCLPNHHHRGLWRDALHHLALQRLAGGGEQRRVLRTGLDRCSDAAAAGARLQLPATPKSQPTLPGMHHLDQLNPVRLGRWRGEGAIWWCGAGAGARWRAEWTRRRANASGTGLLLSSKLLCTCAMALGAVSRGRRSELASW